MKEDKIHPFRQLLRNPYLLVLAALFGLIRALFVTGNFDAVVAWMFGVCVAFYAVECVKNASKV